MAGKENEQNETSVLQKTLDYLTERYHNLHIRIGGDPTRGMKGLEDRVGDLEIFRDRWNPKLEGNGKPPLMQRIQTIEDWQAKKDKVEHQKIADSRDIRIAIYLMVISSLWNIFGDWIKTSLGL